MANRTTKVSLTAEVSGYLAGMDKASKATRDVGTEAEKLAQKKDAIQAVGVGLLAIGAVAAAGVALAVTKYAEFDEAISSVKANTQETTSNMALLREAAIDFGASSVFNATEAANAIEELGKGGVATADILGGALAASLDLASAGGLGIARSAEIAATTMSQFSLKGSEAGRVADTLAAGAGKALGSVDDLAAGLKFVGPVAAAMGVSLEETTGTLALFASAGIVGEQGGTALRGMLSSLTSPSKAAASEIEALGITLYDSNGKFLGIKNAAGELSGAYSGLTDEARDASLGILFGNEQVTAARVLYKEGAEGVDAMTTAVTDSGYAAQVARDKLDNLRGDVEKLGGAFDSALINTGSSANDVLREITQSATFVVDAVGSIPGPALGATLAVTAVAGGVALAGGAALIAVPKLAAMKAQLNLLGVSGRKAAIGIGLAGGAIGVAAIVIGTIIGAYADAAAKTEAYGDTLDTTSKKVTSATRDMVKENLAVGKSFLWFKDDSVFDAAGKLGFSLETITDAAMGSSDALKEIDTLTKESFGPGNVERAEKLGLSVLEYNNAIALVKTGIEGESGSMEESIRIAKQKETADGSSAAKAEEKAVALEVATAATEAETKATEEYLNMLSDSDAAFVDFGGALDGLIQKNQDAAQATADSTESSSDSWEDYYDGFSFGLADYLTDLQAMVDAQNNWESNMVLLSGKVSKGVLDELAAMGPEGAPLVAALVNGSADELAKAEALFAEKAENATGAFALKLQQSQAVIAAAAAQLGQDAANEIAAKLASGTSTVEQIMAEYKLKVEGVVPVVDVNTSTAMAKLAAFRSAIRLTGPGTGSTLMIDPEERANGGTVGFAGGGTVFGPGTSKSDSIPTMLSVGEEVIQEPYASQNRALLKAINSGSYGSGYSSPVQYVASPNSGGGGSAVNVSPRVSLAGATLVMSVDGRQMTAVIQEQIVSTEKSNARRVKMGVQ